MYIEKGSQSSDGLALFNTQNKSGIKYFMKKPSAIYILPRNKILQDNT